MNRIVPAVLFVLAAALSAVILNGLQSTGFPHLEHQGLFPLCESCHSGAVSGVVDELYPDPDRCGICHDGQREDSVAWTPPPPAVSNLAFDHRKHAVETGAAGVEADCGSCHREVGAEDRMAVASASAETCLTCHTHEAPEHLSAGRPCLTCHLPLTAAAELPAARIAAFPAPTSHLDPDFLVDHGPVSPLDAQSCATCHAQESCTRCHVNGASLPAVRALAPDGRVALLEADRAPTYPEPASHVDVEWSWIHGQAALSDAESCANCHTRDSCATCHTRFGEAVLTSLPRLEADDPRGVRLPEPGRVHDPGFDLAHAPWAAADRDTCATCHTTSFCESCHDGPDAAAFHYGNFLQMHGPEAWGNEAECTTCHNADVFCRGCHQGLGRSAAGRLDVAYHSRRPFWLFGHGTAARQGLESCRSCHSQSDCTLCHAAVGAWRINPHGPGFQADRLREANPWSCLACHRTGIPPS